MWSSPSTRSTPAISTTRFPSTSTVQQQALASGVHIADVGHFAPPGGPLDREARKRGTSVYLPQQVIPMFPEMISNSLASLQQDKSATSKACFIDFTPDGVSGRRRFANGAIRSQAAFTYEQVLAPLRPKPAGIGRPGRWQR